MTQNKWVVWRFANQRWTMLGFVYAETEAEAWDKAHKIYGANITQLVPYSRWLDEDYYD